MFLVVEIKTFRIEKKQTSRVIVDELDASH